MGRTRVSVLMHSVLVNVCLSVSGTAVFASALGLIGATACIQVWEKTAPWNPQTPTLQPRPGRK